MSSERTFHILIAEANDADAYLIGEAFHECEFGLWCKVCRRSTLDLKN